MRIILLMAAAFGWSACGSSEPEGIDDCLAMDAGKERDQCLQDTIVEAFREDSDRGEEIISAQDNSEGLRDFMWYLVTREVDPGSNRYCDKIEGEALGSRCREIVARPHLHRDLLDEAGSKGSGAGTKGAGGGPAPGAGSPPPPR